MVLKEKQKIHELKQEIKYLKKLKCRYLSMSDYCDPEYCICSKTNQLEQQLEKLTFKQK
jgi:hypothetical protein